MADLLHNRLSNSSFFFSSPLNLSSHHHRRFSFIRFSPLNRRFSHSSPLLAKFSLDSSQFDIISRTENSDGSVIFKFGDASEVSQAVVESVREDNATSVANNLSEPSKGEQKSDLNSTAIVEVENSSDSVEDELKSGSAVTAEVENSSDTVKELKNDSISTVEVENSSDIDTATHDNQIVDNVVSQSVDVIVEKTGEFSEASALMSDVDKVDDGGDESRMISEASHSVEEHVTEQIDNTMNSEPLEAEPIVNKNDDDSVELMSEHLKAEAVINEEDDDSVELISVQLEAEPILDEETSFVSLDDAVVFGTNKEAAPGPASSGLSSASLSLDSLKTSTTANSVIPVASSPESLKIQHTTSSTVAQLVDDCSDTLMAIHPVTPGITLAEPSLDSRNKEESLAPTISISSAAASLTNSLEDLTGGKDAHFLSDNWFGVADGVGQWSFRGVDVGIYAHELMQNCVKLIKSASAGSTNVKELLQQSAAMTQSTGLARVLIARVANEVLHVANIGDSGFLIIRNGDVFKKSSPMVHEFSFPYAIGLGDDTVEDVEEYHIDLEEGDLIVTATDGLFDNLYEQEIASIVSKSVEAGMHVQDLAELLASKAQEVGRSNSARSPFADAAQAAGHHGFNGGKFDHVTVIVSLVQRR